MDGFRSSGASQRPPHSAKPLSRCCWNSPPSIATATPGVRAFGGLASRTKPLDASHGFRVAVSARPRSQVERCAMIGPCSIPTAPARLLASSR